MKLLASILILMYLFGCASTTTVTEASKKSDCGLEEMLAGISCITPDLAAIAEHPLGSKGNPIKADGAYGQREYLSRLICRDGFNIESARRSGSVGLGPYGFMIDLYLVTCKTKIGTEQLPVYMDLYHKGYREKYPAQGFIDMEL